MRVLGLNLLFFVCFFGFKLLIGEALAFNPLFSGSGLNNHIVYEYRFDANRPQVEGKFVFIKKELRKGSL